jgi:hypothetical protein
VQSITGEEFDNSIGSSGSYKSLLACRHTVASLIILAAVSLGDSRRTLKVLTSLNFRMSHNLTAPSCPQVNSSCGLLVKQSDITASSCA